MKSASAQVLPAPPNLIKALLAGFDTIANHVFLILFPVGLDLFLWFGPRLSLKRLLSPIIQQVASLPGLITPETKDMIQISLEYWSELAERFNLFSILRTYPVGIPSLMVSRQPIADPFGVPSALEISSPGGTMLIWVILVALGLILGTFYFILVAQASLAGTVSLRMALRAWPKLALQVINFTLICAFMLVMMSIPASCLLSIMIFTGLGGGSLAIILFLGLFLWIFFPLIFAPHGIIANDYSAWPSMLESIRLIRLTLASSALLFLAVLVISEGLDILWRVPGETSWLAFISIAAHAFIDTSLLAATFIYYKDATRWVHRLIQQAKLSSIA